jgi:RNA polymerase sigma-70 factor, ECF subfamily
MNVLNDFPVNAPVAPAVTFTAADRGFVYAVARRIVGSAEDADDVTQEAMLLAFRHRSAFRGESRYRTWLYRIAATTALGHLRKRGRSREHLAATDAAFARTLVADTTPVDEALEDHENIVRIQQALAKLDPKYRDVMLLRADLSEVETADKLGISVGNVKVRAHRARHQLRVALGVEADAA